MKQYIVLIVAVVAGFAAAILSYSLINAKEEEVAKLKANFMNSHQVMEVVCFVKDVPGGTRIQKADLGLKKVPANGLRGHAITEDQVPEILERRLTNGRKKGEPLFWSDIEGGNPLSGGLAADIRRKMRAVSINASGAAAVSGMVKPNDHVDVIGTFSFPRTAADGKTVVQELVTCTMLQNVLVLATGKETAKTAPVANFGGSSYSTVTLEVTPREAEMLVFAEQIQGRLSLSLRNRNDTSYERELPQVDFAKIRSEIEELNLKRQTQIGGDR